MTLLFGCGIPFAWTGAVFYAGYLWGKHGGVSVRWKDREEEVV